MVSNRLTSWWEKGFIKGTAPDAEKSIYHGDLIWVICSCLMATVPLHSRKPEHRADREGAMGVKMQGKRWGSWQLCRYKTSSDNSETIWKKWYILKADGVHYVYRILRKPHCYSEGISGRNELYKVTPKSSSPWYSYTWVISRRKQNEAGSYNPQITRAEMKQSEYSADLCMFLEVRCYPHCWNPNLKD